MRPILLPLVVLAACQPKAGPVTPPAAAVHGPSATDVYEARAHFMNNAKALVLCGDVGDYCPEYIGPAVRDVVCRPGKVAQVSCRYRLIEKPPLRDTTCTGEFNFNYQRWFIAIDEEVPPTLEEAMEEACDDDPPRRPGESKIPPW